MGLTFYIQLTKLEQWRKEIWCLLYFIKMGGLTNENTGIFTFYGSKFVEQIFISGPKNIPWPKNMFGPIVSGFIGAWAPLGITHVKKMKKCQIEIKLTYLASTCNHILATWYWLADTHATRDLLGTVNNLIHVTWYFILVLQNYLSDRC